MQIDKNSLKWLAVLLPIFFWIGILLVRSQLLRDFDSLATEGILSILFILGVALFTTWIFRVVEQREAEIQKQTHQLAALNEASMALTREHDLSTVLQKVVDLSRSLVNARYGALGVLDESGEFIEQFITSGLSPEERARMGHPPEGDGLLGVIIREGRAVRIRDISEDTRSVGFPANHPVMHSFLGVPITFQERVIGDLYLTDKIGNPASGNSRDIEFTLQDQRIVEMFANQAAIAIENAQLYRQTQQLAILQERERFGMDLHDGIIQSIYAIGLMLENTQHRIKQQPTSAIEGIERAIHDLNDVISDIRNYILDLRPQRFQGRDLRRGLEELARELRANTFLNVRMDARDVDLAPLTPEQTVEILHIAQEALANVRKHARATDVEIFLSTQNSHILLTVEDNGIGMPAGVMKNSPGNGLRNMRERSGALAGVLTFKHAEPQGTRVTLRVPLHEN